MRLSTTFLDPALANVGWQWFQRATSGNGITLLGSRSTSGIFNAGMGTWFIDETPPEDADGVRMNDSVVTAADVYQLLPTSSGGGAGQFTTEEAAAIVAAAARINAVPGDEEDPVLIIPAAPDDAALCRVYGYLETIDNVPAANVEVVFTLVVGELAAAKSERVLSGRTVKVKTDADGYVELDLQRTDEITPGGATYSITCKKANIAATGIELEAETFDLATLIA